jgi:hypothetical protein
MAPKIRKRPAAVKVRRAPKTRNRPAVSKVRRTEQYVFKDPLEWDRWYSCLLKHATPKHALATVLRKNYGARPGGFRTLRRGEVKLENTAVASRIYLLPQKGWPGEGWESMTEEVHSYLTGCKFVRKYLFEFPAISALDEYIFKPDKSGKKRVSDKSISNAPMSKQSMSNMVARCRTILVKETGHDPFGRIMCKSERASAAYWLSKDLTVPDCAKQKALRMTTHRLMDHYAAKGYVEHDLTRVRRAMSSPGVVGSVSSSSSCSGPSVNLTWL